MNPNIFKCYATGRCCYERYGYETFILPDDAHSLTEGLKLKLKSFFEQFCNVVSYTWDNGYRVKFSVLKREKSVCIFLKEGKCRVHHCKPFVCKAGPIIPPLFDGFNFDEWFQLNCRGAKEAKKLDLSLTYKKNKKELEKIFNNYYEEYFKKNPAIPWVQLIKAHTATAEYKGGQYDY